MTTKKQDNDISFEQSLTQLESAVKKLESGTLTLDESLKVFEEGVSWSRKCESALQVVHGKIEKLVQKDDGSVSTESFKVED